MASRDVVDQNYRMYAGAWKRLLDDLAYPVPGVKPPRTYRSHGIEIHANLIGFASIPESCLIHRAVDKPVDSPVD